MKSKCVWPYLDVNAREHLADCCLNLCWESGACGVYEEYPSPGWCRVFFNNEQNRNLASARLRESGLVENDGCDVLCGSQDDTGWKTAWHRFFQPRAVGHRFLVLPSWAPEPSTPECVIRIHPGQAFGTGNHESTTLCLEIMQDIKVTGMEVLDAGCGSGLLGIAAARLGARSVTAVDCEDTAAYEAAGNAHRNGVASRMRIIKGRIESIPGSFDCILANLHAGFFLKHAGVLVDRVRPAGELVLSGFLTSDTDTIITAVSETGFPCEFTASRCGEWSALHVSGRF